MDTSVGFASSSQRVARTHRDKQPLLRPILFRISLAANKNLAKTNDKYRSLSFRSSSPPEQRKALSACELSPGRNQTERNETIELSLSTLLARLCSARLLSADCTCFCGVRFCASIYRSSSYRQIELVAVLFLLSIGTIYI